MKTNGGLEMKMENDLQMKTENELEMNPRNETKTICGEELEMNSEIHFEVSFKEETLSGFMNLEDADDEAPLQFYDQTNQPQWYVPSNPYRNPVNNHMMHKESDYDFLTEIFNKTDIIQYLVDFKDESGKEIVLHETETEDQVILVIN